MLRGNRDREKQGRLAQWDRTRDAGVVLVRSDVTVDRFAVLGITQPIVSYAANAVTFHDRVALDCTTPTADHVGKFVITIEPITAGGIGRAVVLGAVQAQINVTVDETVTCADVSSGQTYLVPNPQGSAQVLWRAGGTGLQWALVRLGAAVGDSSFDALASTAALMTGHTIRWWYGWGKITGYTILPGSGQAMSVTLSTSIAGTAIAAPSGSNLGGAINFAEAMHVAAPGGTTAHYAGGVQINVSNTSTDYPAGFAPRSLIYGGSRIVRMRPFIDSTGTTRYGFDPLLNTHDGTC